MPTKILDTFLVEIIDNLAPLNNKLRAEKVPVVKIELMWDFGRMLDSYMSRYKLKLHELLYQIYDPHSTLKASNITRDLGSYSHRIYKHFGNRSEIRRALEHLKSYSLFREALPLLFNPVYHKAEKKEVLYLLNSALSDMVIKDRIIKMKQDIRLIKNPRNQKAYIYQEEGDFLRSYIANLKKVYFSNISLPNESKFNDLLGNRDFRKKLTDILLTLSSDVFGKRISVLSKKDVPDTLLSLYNIASGKSADRSRFRRWVLSSNKLLSLAEGIEGLNKMEDYKFYREKMISLTTKN